MYILCHVFKRLERVDTSLFGTGGLVSVRYSIKFDSVRYVPVVGKCVRYVPVVGNQCDVYSIHKYSITSRFFSGKHSTFE